MVAAAWCAAAAPVKPTVVVGTGPAPVGAAAPLVTVPTGVEATVEAIAEVEDSTTEADSTVVGATVVDATVVGATVVGATVVDTGAGAEEDGAMVLVEAGATDEAVAISAQISAAT